MAEGGCTAAPATAATDLFPRVNIHSLTDISQSASDGIHVDSGTPPNATSASYATTGSISTDREDDCVKKVVLFCRDHLKISDPERTIHIDRAHRIGKYQRNKTRPIVAKFMNTNSILCIKNALKNVDLRRSQYNVTEQYPAEVVERRKAIVVVKTQR
ncbi:hypothetical protein DPMN_149333 [Dreissena polymorpha]|uniref:Uncharacterized protein n=1 Tax=Dreissena polymorpha TaxID=45954 RepID=A0A9D4FBH7_DREPO|nr:hypothetical protein DPMN_149333 [Dreissena polymorpha]